MRFRFFLLLIFTLYFLIAYPSADFLTAHIPYRVHLPQFGLPFIPSLATLYLSLNLLFVVVFWKISEQKLGLLFGALLAATTLAWPIFILLPVEHLALPSQPESVSYRLADIINLDRNYFPSLHATYSALCACFVPHPLVIVWALGIVCSTFLTHQHYLLDALAGLALAGLVWGWALGPGRAYCYACSELARCTLRHRRYGVIALGLGLNLVLSPKNGWKALVGFCYLQRLDDILDGHLTWTKEPEEEASRQLVLWTEGGFGSSPLDCLGAKLESANLTEANKLPLIIEQMRLDRIRVRDRAYWSEERLREHLARTFELSLDLMLSATQAELRAVDAPSLPKLLGWCSVVRDLEEDLTLGLVNIPREIVENGEFNTWFKLEKERAVVLYQAAQREVEALQKRSGARILGLFHLSVKKYLKRFDAEALSKQASEHLL